MAVDNRQQNIVNTDVGVKISKPGYDARRSAGQNMLYNSSWPTLAVAYETTIPNPLTSGAGSGTVNHNLTFPPLTFVWATGPDPSGLTGATCTRRIPVVASVDETTVYLSPSGTSLVETDFLYTATDLNIKCFQLDLSRDIDYILASGDTFKSPYDNSFGIKVVKPRKNIESKDLRDYILHSRCQGALVLAVKTQDTINPSNPGEIQYTSKLPTPVWVYGFTRSAAGQYKWAPLGGNAYPETDTDGYQSNLVYGFGDTGASLVILRDPMFAPNVVFATY